jgi:hypothetical protein
VHTIESNTVFVEPLYRIDEKIVVIIGSSWADLGENDKALLVKILLSVGLSVDSVVILPMPLDLIKVLSTHRPSVVLCFDPTQNGIEKLYTLVNIGDTTLVKADRLAELNDDKKKALWGALRQVFKP